jgi:hypothetical protein
MGKFGDNYYRSGTAAAVATFISGQSMNIAGTATNLSGGTVSATTGSFSGAVTASSVYTRSAAGQGWLSGNYASVETGSTSGAIYSIGGAYVPTSTTLGNMYGIGYTVGTVTGQSGVPADWGMYVAAGGVSRIFLCGGDGTIRLTGALTAGGNVTAYSDERVKTNWRGYGPDFIERLAKIKHGTFDRTDTELTQDGVSAQSLQELLPHSVLEDTAGKLSVAYGNAALVAAVKLAERVVALEARLAALEAKG